MTSESICKCKDCTDRFVGCHSVCESYKAYRKLKDEEHKKRCDEVTYRADRCARIKSFRKSHH